MRRPWPTRGSQAMKKLIVDNLPKTTNNNYDKNINNYSNKCYYFICFAIVTTEN